MNILGAILSPRGRTTMNVYVIMLVVVASAFAGVHALDFNEIKKVVEAITDALNEEGQTTMQGREISYAAKGRVHSADELWVYDGIAWDIASGVSVKVNNFAKKQDAINAAKTALLRKLKEDGIIKDEL